MKKAFFLTTLVLLSLGTSFAQDRASSTARRQRTMGGLFRQLNLTDEQKKDIEKLQFDLRKKNIDQEAALKTARLELAQLFKADNPDQATIEKKVSQISQLQAQQHVRRVDHWFAVNKLLTPEQQKVWKRVSGRLFLDQRIRRMQGRRVQMLPGNSMRLWNRQTPPTERR